MKYKYTNFFVIYVIMHALCDFYLKRHGEVGVKGEPRNLF